MVIATEGESAFGGLTDLILVPTTHPALAYLLSTMVGHLFGYEAALALDSQALPLREARVALQQVMDAPLVTEQLLARACTELAGPMARFHDGVSTGRYDGAMSCSTAARILSAFRFFDGSLAAGILERQSVSARGPAVDEMLAALRVGIDELTRPVDAVKHQAKTVTVGITRRQKNLFDMALVERVLAAGASRDRLADATLRCLGALDAAVAEVTGSTRYELAGDATRGYGRVLAVQKSGCARGLTSRTETDPHLRGTKQLVAAEGQVLLTRGTSDGRPVVVVPETDGRITTSLILLHVRLHDRLPAASMRSVLDGYRGRLTSLAQSVNEAEASFREDRLGAAPVEELLIAPVEMIARR